MAGVSPTQRSLKMLRELGFTAAVTEKWNPHAKIRQDLFGVIDILGIREGIGILGVQACSRTDHARRRDKCLAEPKLRKWLEAGGRFEIWSWSLMGKAGKVKRWEVWREEIKLSGFGNISCSSGQFADPVESLELFQ